MEKEWLVDVKPQRLGIFSSWKAIWPLKKAENIQAHPPAAAIPIPKYCWDLQRIQQHWQHLAPYVSSPTWFKDASSSTTYVRWEGTLTTFTAHLCSVAMIWICNFQSPVYSRKCKFNFWRENRDQNVLVLLTAPQIMRISRTAWGFRQDKGQRWTASLVSLL